MIISIISKEFGGLMLDLEMNMDGTISNAYFAATGNELPLSMWIRLNKNTADLLEAYETMQKELEYA